MSELCVYLNNISEIEYLTNIIYSTYYAKSTIIIFIITILIIVPTTSFYN